jgi:type II secretory pathway component GspD/PulD (secretin)
MVTICLAGGAASAVAADQGAAKAPQPGQAAARETRVFRLRNSPATDVAEAIQTFLQGELKVSGGPAGAEVVVVPEVLSNSLLVSGRPEALASVGLLIEALDRRPSSIRIKLLIVQRLGRPDQKPGKEGPQRGQRKASPSALGLPKGSSVSPEELEKGMKPTAPEASAAKTIDEALQDLREEGIPLEVVCRTQIMTLDNQPAFVQVGSREPVFTGVTAARGGPTRQVSYEDVGIEVSTTPRISPEGWVVLEIDLEKSQLAPAPAAASEAPAPADQTVGASRVVTVTAQSTVAVADGRTVVLGGMITDSDTGREELLIVLQAEIIDNEAEGARKKRAK